MAKVVLTIDVPGSTIAQLNDRVQKPGDSYGAITKLQSLLSGISAGQFDASYDILVSDVAPSVKASVVSGSDVISLLAHGLADGNIVKFSSVGAVAGLSVNTEYYVRFAATDSFKLSATASPVVITGAASDIVANKIQKVAHGLVDGQVVRFTDVDTVTNIAVATDYYVVNKSNDDFEVSLSSGGVAIDLDGVDSLVLKYEALLNITTGGTLVLQSTGSGSTLKQYSLK